MLFGYNLIDKTKDEYLREIATMARDPKTLIFLDTNILAYLYKLHAAARLEFFVWAESVLKANRLRIPAWSAGEYLSRVKTRNLHSYTPKNKDPDQPKKALDVMLETAALFVDEAVLRAIGFRGDRTRFLTEFRNAVDALPQYTSAFKHQFDPEAVHEEIQTRLSSAILKSDLADLCARAAREGDVRVEHRLPPAFRDEDKKENRFGDLIIWFEILQYSKEHAADLPKVLFITNDEKSDWVYAPQRRKEVVRGVRKAVPNDQPELKLVDPRLVSEFQRVVGHANIVICNLPSLIEGLSKESALEFGQLAAAIQINLSDVSTLSNASGALLQGAAPEVASAEARGDLAAPGLGDSEPRAMARRGAPQSGLEESETGEPGTAAPRLSYGPDALRDGAYESDVSSAINEIISALKSHNWYTQNPAIDRIKTIRDQEFSPTSWFVLGRNIYQAACGNAQKAMDFVVNLDIQLSRFPSETAQHLLAGMLFEIYFDSHGEFRREPKARFIEKPLQQVVAEQFSDVRDFILHHLQAHRARLRFLPGDTRSLTLRLISAPILAENDAPEDDRRRELRSVQLDEVQLIRDREESEANTWGRFGVREFTTDTLVQKVSRALAIPHWAITREFEPAVRPDVVFVVPDGRELHVEAAMPDAQT